MDREAWCAAVHGVTKSQMWLNWTELNQNICLVFGQHNLSFIFISMSKTQKSSLYRLSLKVWPVRSEHYTIHILLSPSFLLSTKHTHTHTHIPSFQNMFLKLCQYQMDQQVSVDFLFLLHCLLVCDILSSLHPIPAWEARPSKAAIGGISENNIVFKKHCCPFLIPLSMIRPCHLISLSNISRK